MSDSDMSPIKKQRLIEPSSSNTMTICMLCTFMEERFNVLNENVSKLIENVVLNSNQLNMFQSSFTKKFDELEKKVTNLAYSLQVISENQKENIETITVMPEKVKTNVALEDSEQVVKLNKKQDFPNGSWLGNPNSATSRVRCNIPPGMLDQMRVSSPTAEKLALSLVDNLFSQETLANSNLSGRSRQDKQQLDPLLIYGIHCHLLYHFNISSTDWKRIKNNIDAKCRFARKKQQKTEAKEDSKEDPQTIPTWAVLCEPAKVITQPIIAPVVNEVVEVIHLHNPIMEPPSEEVIIPETTFHGDMSNIKEVTSHSSGYVLNSRYDQCVVETSDDGNNSLRKSNMQSCTPETTAGIKPNCSSSGTDQVKIEPRDQPKSSNDS